MRQGEGGDGKTSFFGKKEAKKLLIPLVRGRETAGGRDKRKFFASFFQKRSTFFALLCLLFLGLNLASADTPTTIKRDGVVLTIPQEKRAEHIGNKLRCLVCQNETVENSQAGLAKQFRGIIRRRVVRHEGDRKIIDFMVHRYGIFVLLKPPLIPVTWLLWFSPGIAVLIGLIVLIVARRRRVEAAAALSPAERERLKELLS